MSRDDCIGGFLSKSKTVVAEGRLLARQKGPRERSNPQENVNGCASEAAGRVKFVSLVRAFELPIRPRYVDLFGGMNLRELSLRIAGAGRLGGLLCLLLLPIRGRSEPQATTLLGQLRLAQAGKDCLEPGVSVYSLLARATTAGTFRWPAPMANPTELPRWPSSVLPKTPAILSILNSRRTCGWNQKCRKRV